MKHIRKLGVLCAAILFLSSVGCLWALRPAGGNFVNILQDGAVIYKLDLSEMEDQTIQVAYEGRVNVIQIQNGRISVCQADCPDQTCVHMGELSAEGMPIICLPNRLIIQYAHAGVDGATN